MVRPRFIIDAGETTQEFSIIVPSIIKNNIIILRINYCIQLVLYIYMRCYIGAGKHLELQANIVLHLLSL